MRGFLLPGNYREFFHMIDSCEKEVEIYTKDGFHLNLKSKLGQFVVFTSILRSKRIRKFHLVTRCEEDTLRILEFLVNGSQRLPQK